MSSIEKAVERLHKRPIPTDITFDEIERLAVYFGCEVKTGGKHIKIVNRFLGVVIPIPRHGNCVKSVYISMVKDLFDRIEENREGVK